MKFIQYILVKFSCKFHDGSKLIHQFEKAINFIKFGAFNPKVHRLIYMYILHIYAPLLHKKAT